MAQEANFKDNTNIFYFSKSTSKLSLTQLKAELQGKQSY